MIYVPPELHLAMRRVELEDGARSTSDVYVQAAKEFLANRGLTVAVQEDNGGKLPVRSGSSLADVLFAIEGLGRRVEEALEHGGKPASTGVQPAGTRAAEAMRAVLDVLREAGPDGLSGPELTIAVHGRGVRSGAAETAKAVLREAGLVRCEGRLWCLNGPDRTG